MNTYKYTIYGTVPPKKNSQRIVYYHGRPHIIASEQHEKWENDSGKQIAAPPQPIEHASITATFYLPDYRRRDLSNMWQSVEDLLVKRGVIKDDCWKVLSEITLKGKLDRENSRVVVTILKLDK